MQDHQSAELIGTPGAIAQIEELARKPFVVEQPSASLLVAVPDGYNVEDLTHHLPHPIRKRGTVNLHDVDSFIATVKRYGSLANSVVYVNADYAAQKVSACAVFNEHGEDTHETGWRDHRAVFAPRFTEEWKRWLTANVKAMEQAEFAFFLEANLGDIVQPTGGEVLEFVTTLQDTRQVTYGRAVNLANGMVQLEFTEKGDDATKGKLEICRKFTLGLRPFAGGQPYSVEALLRYRIDRNSGAVKFWFDLQRADRVLEDACRETVERIRTEAGVPLVYGTPD